MSAADVVRAYDALKSRRSRTMDIAARTANGDGRFVHNFAGGGSASGTYTANRLVSFQFYVPGGEEATRVPL
jgi:hypothetical protein